MSTEKEQKPMGRPKTRGKRQNVTMQWPIDFTEQVDAVAHARGITRTEMVLQVLEKELARD